MTPEERQLITGLFDRIRQQGAVDKDREADALIRDGIRQIPDAPYMLVQSVLVQEMALQQAQARVDELERRVRDLEDQSRPAQQSSGGSFLGGLFGAQKPAAPQGSSITSVPAAGRPQPQQRPSSPWGSPPAQDQQPMYRQAQQPMAPQYGQGGGGGGGFMRSAMSTAAGVAGGMLAANAISNMLGGHHAGSGGGLFGSEANAAPAAQPAQAVPTSGTDDNDPGNYDDNSQGNGDDNDPGYDDNDPGYDDGGDSGSEDI